MDHICGANRSGQRLEQQGMKKDKGGEVVHKEDGRNREAELKTREMHVETCGASCDMQDMS